MLVASRGYSVFPSQWHLAITRLIWCGSCQFPWYLLQTANCCSTRTALSFSFYICCIFERTSGSFFKLWLNDVHWRGTCCYFFEACLVINWDNNAWFLLQLSNCQHLPTYWRRSHGRFGWHSTHTVYQANHTHCPFFQVISWDFMFAYCSRNFYTYTYTYTYPNTFKQYFYSSITYF